MKSVKVANILEEGRYGGPQARVISVASELERFNIKTTVIYSTRDSEIMAKKLEEKRVNSCAVNLTRLTREKKVLALYISRFLYEIYLLYKILKKGRFDVIHVNGAYQIKGAIAGKLAGIPVIWHLNDSCMPLTVKMIFRTVAGLCVTGFIFTGKNVYDYYLSGSALEDIPRVMIQAPVDTNIFDPETVVGDENLESFSGVRIVTIANIEPMKGYNDFVDMAIAISKRFDNVHFYSAGAIHRNQEKYFKELTNRIKNEGPNNITFLGRSDNVASVLKAADIFVFASLSEASPMSLWEAMSMGLPVVTTDVGSVREFIHDGECGFIVSAGDIEELTNKLEILVKDKELRKEFGRKARSVAVMMLDTSICVENHREFYMEIVKSYSNGLSRKC